MKKIIFFIMFSFLVFAAVGCKRAPQATITLDKENIEIFVSESYDIVVNIENAKDETLSYTVSDPSIISVVNGKVTGLKAGSTTVEIVLNEDQEQKATLNVTVKGIPTILVAGEKTEVFVGDYITLEAITENVDGAVAWSSSDETVATVANGVVTAVKEGVVIIKASYNDFEGSIEITVLSKPSIVISGPNELFVDEFIELTADIQNIDDEDVEWTSSNEEIAKVSDGTVKGCGAGEATITVTCGDYSAEYVITVKGIPTISLPTTSEVEVESTITLNAEVQYAEGTIVWTSSNEAVATVDQNGVVTGVSSGEAVITASLGEDLKAQTTVTVFDKPYITIAGETVVKEYESIKLTATLVNASGVLEWLSSDETIATVDQNGNVKGLKKGTVTITVSYENYYATVEVTVNEIANKLVYDFNGGVAPELYALNDGASFKLTSYNSSNGSFWGGGYANNIYITTKAFDPKATFSDRIYIGKNPYNGYYEVVQIITSGSSSWHDAAEYVISISSSYNEYSAAHKETAKVKVGDFVFIDKTISSISGTNPASCKIYSPEVSTSQLIVLPSEFTGKLITPTRLGFEFLGWYDENNNKVTSLSSISGTIKLTAKWNELNPVQDIVTNDIPTEMVTGDTFQVVANVSPTDAFFQQVFYSTSNRDILSVTSDGLITAINKGTATISVRDYVGKITKTFEITVYAVPSIDVLLDREYDGVLNVNENISIEATFEGKTSGDVTFTFSSANPAIASVDASGVVSAKSQGETEIIITANADKTYTFKLGVVVNGLAVEDKIDEVIKLIAESNFATVETGNACLLTDGQTKQRYYKATYGSVNKILFDDLTVKQDYVAKAEANGSGHKDRRSTDTIQFVTVHDTATLTGTANAIASNMSGGSTSIHYAVGDREVYAVVPEKYIAYHAGDGTSTTFEWYATGAPATENVAPEFDMVKVGSSYYFTVNGVQTNIKVPTTNGTKTISNPSKAYFTDLGPVWKVENGQYYMGKTWVCFSQVAAGVISSYGGNNNSIGIEMCVNTSGDKYDTIQRTAMLVADILVRNDLDLTRVKQHNTWTGKNCPQMIRSGGYWDNFMEMVELHYLLQTTYKDAEITVVSNNPEIVDNTGHVINAPVITTNVSYEVTVTIGGQSKSIKLHSVVPGTTTWEQWNGLYDINRIWNNGQFER